MVHTKALVGVPGDDDMTRHPELQFMAMTKQEHQARHLCLSPLLACIFSSLTHTFAAFELFTISISTS